MKKQTVMRTKGFHKLSSLVLAFAIAITTVFATAEPVAAYTMNHYETKTGTADAGVEIKISFTVTIACNVEILLNINRQTDAVITFYNTSGELVNSAWENPKKIPAKNFLDFSVLGVTNRPGYWWSDVNTFSLPEGNYQLGLTFSDSVTYKLDYSVDEEFIDVDFGFLQEGDIKQMITQVHEEDRKKIASWTSSNEKVASVDKNGTVTAKSKGSTTITAWTSDGKVVYEDYLVVGNLWETDEPEMKQLQIAEGFTKKLGVQDSKVTSWSSDNKKVAVVDSKGNLTAKKAGKAIISAKLDDGNILKCEITVVKNVYSVKKIRKIDLKKGEWGLEVYKGSFDTKGNLVIKARAVSRLSDKISSIRDLKIVIKDGEGKTVGTYKKKKIKTSIAPGGFRDFTFVIKKSGLKKKKVQLPFTEITVSAYAE